MGVCCGKDNPGEPNPRHRRPGREVTDDTDDSSFYSSSADDAPRGFMITLAPSGQTWWQYCQSERVTIDGRTGFISGPWAECLAWAKVFEIRSPSWQDEAEFSDGPCGQVIEALVNQSPDAQRAYFERAAMHLEEACDRAASQGQPFPVINRRALEGDDRYRPGLFGESHMPSGGEIGSLHHSLGHHAGYAQKLGQLPGEVGMLAPAPSGVKRALLIGCNYPGSQAQLSGCINDAHRMSGVLQKMYGFSPSCMRVLTDDGRSPSGLPTRANILDSIRWLVSEVRPGDVLFFHFSGHGAQELDPSYSEEDGYDETICPTDFQQAGQIVDDEIFDNLCMPLPSGVKLTAVLDCCHSGTGLDLPFTFNGYAWSEETNPCHSAGDVQLISGCEDCQTSADASGRYGEPAGAMTTALCDTLEANGGRIPYCNLIGELHAHLMQRGFEQRPQLTSSQAFDTKSKWFSVVDGIVPNSNPVLGRQFRKAKHPQQAFGGGLGEMLASSALGFMAGGLAGALVEPALENAIGGVMPSPGEGLGFGGGFFDMFGGGDDDYDDDSWDD